MLWREMLVRFELLEQNAACLGWAVCKHTLTQLPNRRTRLMNLCCFFATGDSESHLILASCCSFCCFLPPQTAGVFISVLKLTDYRDVQDRAQPSLPRSCSMKGIDKCYGAVDLRFQEILASTVKKVPCNKNINPKLLQSLKLQTRLRVFTLRCVHFFQHRDERKQVASRGTSQSCF